MEGWHMLLAVWNGAKPRHLDGKVPAGEAGTGGDWEGLGEDWEGLWGFWALAGTLGARWHPVAWRWGLILQEDSFLGGHGHRHWLTLEGP